MRRPPLLALALALPSPALAAEGEIVLGLEPGYVILGVQSPEHGAALGASVSAGITDLAWLTFAAGGARTLTGETDRTLLEALGGLTLALDVLSVIPFGEALVGAVWDGDHLAPVLRAGLGADWVLSPRFSAGAVVRYRPLPDTIANDGLFSIDLRFCLRLDP